MYSRIVVPLDGSELAEQVLPHAYVLAKALKSRVVLLRTYEVGYPPEGSKVSPSFAGDMEGALVNEATKYLERHAAALNADGVNVAVSVLEGAPADRIVGVANAEPDTLVAMATHGRSGMSRLVMGSVADKVLHATIRPLLAIHPHGKGEPAVPSAFSRILVPLDGSPLAEQALTQAVALAKALSIPLVLARVTPSEADYQRFAGYAGEFGSVVKQVDSDAAKYIDSLESRVRGQGLRTVQKLLLHGEPSSAIIDQSQAAPGTLVIMTTHGRTGLGRFVLGSVADRVVSYAGSAVLIIRPEGGK